MATPIPTCTADHTDESLARTAQQYLPDGITATHVAELFKALSDPTRCLLYTLTLPTKRIV